MTKLALSFSAFVLAVSTIHAATLDATLDYDENGYFADLTDSFDFGSPLGTLSGGQITFNMAGRRSYTNSRGYTWHYDHFIDLNIGGTLVWDNQTLPAEFHSYTFTLAQSALDQLATTGQLGFTIHGEDAYWYNDYGNDGVSPSRTYLDLVALNVTTVPLPASLWLFGSAMLGMGLLQRRTRKG